MRMPKYSNGFAYTEHESAVNIPLTWKKPRRIFVNSMSDLFHENATHEFTARCFEVMLRANWHTYQILTKRPHRMADYSRRFEELHGRVMPGHIWLGTSIENADLLFRMDELRMVRCKMRFISFEPLLGPVGPMNLDDIHWVIIGGESGTGYRPVKKEWILDIISQCQRQDVPVFFKQWGGPRPKSGGRRIDGKVYSKYPKT
jgi:protein gp37